MRLTELYILNGDWTDDTILTIIVFGNCRVTDKILDILDEYGDNIVTAFKGNMVVLEDEHD